MARERISFVPEEQKQELNLESRIKTGEITAANFSDLTQDEQGMVNELLFKMASEKIEPNQGLSAIEFILFGFMRISIKKLNGVPLNSDDMVIEQQLATIMEMHQITNDNLSRADWLFDYMSYAQFKAGQFLENREEHITRKQQVTGKA